MQHSDGYIDSLKLEDGSRIEADLFIDCTGFRGLLIEGALKTGFIDWSDVLPCDTAVALPCKAKDPDNLSPYTQSKAQSCGWIWRIPLQHRIGNGYVYSSKHLNDEDAVKILKAQMEGEPIGEPNFLRWKTGVRNKAWNKNCLAIGLSAGFVEPLESTGLHLIQSALTRFMGLFPNKDFNQTDIDTFNTQTKTEVEYIRDFIILHYKVTDRDDSEFWRYCKEMKVPARLQAKMDLYQANARIFREENELFNDDDCILRRVVTKEGRSKAYINGSQVPASQLKAIGSLLVSIHGQHAHQLLIKPDHQRFMLDQYAGSLDLLAKVKLVYQELQSKTSEFKQLTEKQAEFSAQKQLLNIR